MEWQHNGVFSRRGDVSLVLLPIGPTSHWFYGPLVLRPIGCTSNWSYVPLILRPTGPTCASLGLRASTQSRHCHKSTDSLCCQSRILCLTELLRVSHTAFFPKIFLWKMLSSPNQLVCAEIFFTSSVDCCHKIYDIED